MQKILIIIPSESGGNMIHWPNRKQEFFRG